MKFLEFNQFVKYLQLLMAYSEKYIVKNLLSHSEEFHDYYNSERKKIHAEIIWECNKKLPKGINFRTSKLRGKHYVYLRKVPPAPINALKIAHELQHIVHHSIGVPSVGVKDVKYDYLSSAINSCVHDLLVNRDLIEYGFDLYDEYLDERKTNRATLTKIRKEPVDKLSLLHWAFNYAASILDYEFVLSEYDIEADYSYFEWFESRYPNTSVLARKIKEIVDTIGYDTDDKLRTFFIKIIEEFGLKGIIFL